MAVNLLLEVFTIGKPYIMIDYIKPKVLTRTYTLSDLTERIVMMYSDLYFQQPE